MHGAFSCKAKLRLRSNGVSPASRHFVTLPKKISSDIKKLHIDQPRKGRGSVKVEVQVGFCKRKTSIFPSKPHDAYLLPIKASVRKDLDITDGSTVLVYITCI